MSALGQPQIKRKVRDRGEVGAGSGSAVPGGFLGHRATISEVPLLGALRASAEL